MTYIVSSGALNSTHSLTAMFCFMSLKVAGPKNCTLPKNQNRGAGPALQFATRHVSTAHSMVPPLTLFHSMAIRLT